MPHIIAITGTLLRDMLLADGWQIDWERSERCQLSKDEKETSFYLTKVLSVKQIEAIAHNKAGWDVLRFGEIMAKVVESLTEW